MTPQEINEYKMRWRPDAWSVGLHSDLDWKGKDWCRKNLERWQWSFDKWTDVYEHTFRFEYQSDANAFREQFKGRAR
jgi:hypothetical protein